MNTCTPTGNTQNSPLPEWNQTQKTAGIALLVGGSLVLLAGTVATIAFANGAFAQAINLRMLNGTLLGRHVFCGCFLTGAVLIGVGGTVLYTARSKKPEKSDPLPTPQPPSPDILNPELYKSPFPFDFWYLGEECDQAYGKVYHEVFNPGDGSPINVAPLKSKLEELRVKTIAKYTENIESLRQSDIKDKLKHIATLEYTLSMFCQRYQAKLDLINKFALDSKDLITPLSNGENFESLHLKALIEIEEALGIRDNLRKLLSHILNGMKCKDLNWRKLNGAANESHLVNPEALAQGLRTLRKFFCDRDLQFHYNSGEKGGGFHGEVFHLLKPFVDFSMDTDISFRTYGPMRIEKGYLIHDYLFDSTTLPRWVQACFEQRGGHILIHVYTYDTSQPHFVELDNLHPQPKIASLEGMQRILTGSYNCPAVELFIHDPQNFVMPAVSPKPETWILPTWERENCFIVVVLVALALKRFYAEQIPPKEV